MVKQEWVVRIIISESPFENSVIHETANNKMMEFAEHLRYAGLAKIHEPSETQGVLMVFDLKAPHDVNTKVWADQNAERMKSFGINAAAAPEWK